MEAQKKSFTYRDLFSRAWVWPLITGLLFLAFSMLANHYAFVYAHAYSVRPSSSYVGDIILDNIPVVNLNFIIVEGMLLSIAAGIVFLILRPRYIPFTLKTLALFMLTRAIFMSLTHVGIYPDHIEPGLGIFDSVYLYFNFQTGLFFSGHTCMPIIAALILWNKPFWRYVALALSVIFGVSVLLAHVHYSIDVFAAPFMAYGIFNMSKYFFKREYELIRPTYLDHAAGFSGNPSSPHEEGRRAKKILEDARTIIARLIEVQPDDIVFTSGATEANALAIIGHVRALRSAGNKYAHVLYLPSSHASMVENIKLLAEEWIVVEPLPISDYRVDIEALKKMIRPETVLVSMDAVCGETGVVWNTREVADVLKKFRAVNPEKQSAPAARPIQLCFSGSPALHIDASQAPLTEKITRAHFGADMLTFDASKVGSTRGIGAFVAHRTIPITPFYNGGGQERGLHSGSEAFELAKSFAADLKTATLGREKFRASAERERKYLTNFIKSTIKNVYINEAPADRQAPNILNLSFPNADTDYLVALLDEAGFAVSTRSACETNSEDGSRAVLALTGDQSRALSTLRISWAHPLNTVLLSVSLKHSSRLSNLLTSAADGSIIGV